VMLVAFHSLQLEGGKTFTSYMPAGECVNYFVEKELKGYTAKSQEPTS
jgi:hypothetical protein